MPRVALRNRRAARAAACIAAALLLLPAHGALGSEPGAAKKAVPTGSGAAAPHQPGAVIRDCDQCPELVVVPAGAFRMGDLSGGGDVDEHPVRTVTLPRAFAVARYETTFAEWDACAAAGACRQGVDDLGFGRGRRPVMLVGWADARRVHEVAVAADGKAVPPAERGGMGVRRAGGSRDPIPLGG